MVTTNRPLHKESKKPITDLAAIQKMMAASIMQPLQDGEHIQEVFLDGRQMAEVAQEFIKPNRFLSSVERLELYNRQYWFRLLDAFYEDFPGLMVVLGDKKCEALATAYLTRYPSSSFTLRDLGSSLERFVLEEPQWAEPDHKLALDLIRFEWAEVVAFDAGSKPAITQESLRDTDPLNLKLEFQPYLTLLELDHAIDNFLLKLNKKSDRTVESNAVIQIKRKTKRRSRPKREHNYVAVHRLDSVVYYKRLLREQFLVLRALSKGKTLGEACTESFELKDGIDTGKVSGNLSKDFSTWMDLGWFCGAS
jgi:Putative DNA-binding domain